MAIRIIRRLRDLLDVDTSAAVPGDALVLDVDGETWIPGAGGGGGADDQTAAEVPFTPAGNIVATDVQSAVQELDADKAATSHVHSGDDITTGTVADARIASTIARDSEVSSAITTSEAGQVRDGDAAGGVLSGTYPSPGFASDMATQAELDAHVNDTSAAHAATAIAYTPTGSIAATTVQAAIDEAVSEAVTGAPTGADYLVGTANGGLSAEIVVGTSPGGELGGTWASPTVDATHSGSSHASIQSAAEATAQAALDAHTGDTSDAHDASAISIVDAANWFTVATDVEAALAEAAGAASSAAEALEAHELDSSAAHAASAISASSATLSGTGTDVQAVLEELDNLLDDHSARHEDGGTDEISLAGLSGEPADTVNKSLYDANTVLAATSDNTPAAVTMAASTILARLAAGNIKAASVAEIVALLAAYTVGGTDVALADGGTGASLVDPNADRILFWDDSAGAVTWLAPGTGLTITTTTLDASGGSSATDYVPAFLFMGA